MSKKIKFPQKSEIRKKLLQEAATLEKNKEFLEVMRNNPIEETLLIFRFKDGHTHRIYPSEEVTIQLLTEALEEDFGVDTTDIIEVESLVEEVKLPRQIVFHNRQALGDILMFTCAVRDFKRAFPEVEVQVQSTAMHIWDHNPYINRDKWIEVLNPHTLHADAKSLSDIQRQELNRRAIQIASEKDIPVLAFIGPGKATNASNRSDNHFANAYRISMETLLGVRIPQGPIRPDVYMTEEEYSAPPLVEPPYWLITAGEKGDWTCKTYAFERWQKVVEHFPQVKFVQLGSTGHKHPVLSGDNVVNFIGKTQDRHTGIRDLFNLFNYCEGSMGLVSFQMHLAAAFNKPAVVIAGAREPVHFTRYSGQQYLATDGCLPCTVDNGDSPKACWFCKIERCPYVSETVEQGQKIPLCADLISSFDVIKAVSNYYVGGRLKFDKPVGRSKLVNRVKSTVREVKPAPVEPDSVKREEIRNALQAVVDEKGSPPAPTDNSGELTRENLWGEEFGGGALTERDWEFMKAVIEQYNVKTILEFGAGLSTLLMNDLGLDIITFETSQGWIDKIKALNPNCEIRQWDGINWDYENVKCDLVFVDGPAGGINREVSTKVASEMSELVIIHDAGREWERKWQAEYLEDEFYLASKGGHRCHFWKKGQLPKLEILDSEKLVRFVFNGRGEGGAERSTRWMMEELIRRGYQVQYISPNEFPSGTFRNAPVQGVQFTNNLSELKQPCDYLFLYANDWIWEFKNLEEVFSNTQAKRKVIAVNYKMGGVGEVKWTLNWDKYLFLNSDLERELINRHKRKVGTIPLTRVMAPPTDLSDYFSINPSYEGNLKLLRHSSQGDAKYPKDFNDMLNLILYEVPGCEIFLMPAPSFLEESLKNNDRIHVHLRNKPPVKEFLTLGNAFWYKLPEGYTEGGPKVIMEAQAAGLPIIAENHSGAVDRLVNGGGYLCNSFEEHLSAIKNLNANEPFRRAFGNKSREHAKNNYDPMLWIEEILGEVNPQIRCDTV